MLLAISGLPIVNPAMILHAEQVRTPPLSLLVLYLLPFHTRAVVHLTAWRSIDRRSTRWLIISLSLWLPAPAVDPDPEAAVAGRGGAGDPRQDRGKCARVCCPCGGVGR